MAENNKNHLSLKHNVGDTVQLQLPPGKEEDRHYVKLIGFLEGKGIIVATPRDNGYAMHINNEQPLVVRLVTGNSAIAFNAAVIHTTSHPYPHLHLTYPDNLESITVRKAERVGCKLIVSVQNEVADKSLPESISASMDDMSTAGAQLSCNQLIGDKGDIISIACKIHVGDIEQYLNIMGIIRRITENNASKAVKYEYGIEFIIDDDKEKLLLQGFLYEQMLNIST